MTSRWFFLLLAFWLSVTAAPLSAEPVAAAESPAVQLYQRFARAFLLGNLEQAASLAQGKALAVVKRKQELVAREGKTPPPLEIEFYLMGENPSKEGAEVELLATVLARTRLGPGQPVATEVHRQDAVVARRPGGWKIIHYRDNREKCCIE